MFLFFPFSIDAGTIAAWITLLEGNVEVHLTFNLLFYAGLDFQLFYHVFNKEEQLAALEEEKLIMEARRKLKEAGVIGSAMDALDGAASLVGSGVGMVGTGIGAGVGLVGSGIGAGVGLVGSGLGAVGSGLSKAGKFMGRSFTGHSSSSRRSGSTTPVNSTPENGSSRPLQ